MLITITLVMLMLLGNAELPVFQPMLSPATNVGSAGITVYIDPATGQIAPPVSGKTLPPVTLSPDMLQAVSSSSVGLNEVKNPLPGGGYSVDLQGRFQSTIGVTIAPDGTVIFQDDLAVEIPVMQDVLSE